MILFTKLKLTGFKSFVDPVELFIEPGLTGIVGPNGCGKSNLVEALKWVMGEISARQLRGSEMNDVIFSGTSSRPERNIAEVVIELDNTTRQAPAAFNDADTLEVVRRIDRNTGSDYRINGKEARARDIQLLFADASSGARSVALVSQGQIGDLINAKPTRRREILEEAAGIMGLYSRRREAELRLKGAATNLERLDDVATALATQLRSLKKQARQASRYRDLSEHIRCTEAILFYLRWGTEQEALDQARTQLHKLETNVVEMTSMVAAAAISQAKAADVLPDLRHKEVEAAAELQRFNIERSKLHVEEQHTRQTSEDLHHRLAQADNDMKREHILLRDAEIALEQLETEHSFIKQTCEHEEEAQKASYVLLKDIDQDIRKLDKALHALTGKIAAEEILRSNLKERLVEAERQQHDLKAHIAQLKNQRTELQNLNIYASELEKSTVAVETVNAAVEKAYIDLTVAETDRSTIEETAQLAAKISQEAQAQVTRLEAEEHALSEILENNVVRDLLPLLDQINISPGFEAALGAALGEELEAPIDETAPVHWRTISTSSDTMLPCLPAGVTPLSNYVNGPAFLSLRLSQIGVVADTETGGRLAGFLFQGQRLVSRDGDLWRWDGFTITAGALVPAAVRLIQRNRLTEIQNELAVVRGQAEKKIKKTASLHQKMCIARETEQTARKILQAAEEELRDVRDKLTNLTHQSIEAKNRFTSIEESYEHACMNLSDIKKEILKITQAFSEVSNPEATHKEISCLRSDLAYRRAAQIKARRNYDLLKHEAEIRQQRLNQIAQEKTSWTERYNGSKKRIAELKERKYTIQSDLTRFVQRPKEISVQREKLKTLIEAAEIRRRDVADRLAKAEVQLRDTIRTTKDRETRLQKVREERVRAEARVEQCNQTGQTLASHINERLGCEPDGLWALTKEKDPKQLPETTSVEDRLRHLIQERDNIGPVNLCAENEMTELAEQISTLDCERKDLLKAIDKLRWGISELNKEGRQRLLASFEEVNQHFQKLFVRLFDGGHARLALMGADDPLEAGLEILASPPGKKLQSLSLLSGGEQALTTIALLFGIFMANPAPICVLDEVDAPLDDANVDRFCSLIEEIVRSSLTRFLIVTHHYMTMARMDRLYGVTMQERGISKLVSVDLQRAEKLCQSA